MTLHCQPAAAAGIRAAGVHTAAAMPFADVGLLCLPMAVEVKIGGGGAAARVTSAVLELSYSRMYARVNSPESLRKFA